VRTVSVNDQILLHSPTARSRVAGDEPGGHAGYEPVVVLIFIDVLAYG
jgi:hypothetical protein